MANGIARSGFDVDLAHGEARESAFVRALSDVRIECKADGKAMQTGNLAIEIRQGSTERGKGKPSGLSVTTARFWAIEFADDRWVMVRTSVLKNVVKSFYKAKGSVMGGDYNKFELVLVPLSVLISPDPEWVGDYVANE